MARLFGRAGRLTAKHGGFRRGQELAAFARDGAAPIVLRSVFSPGERRALLAGGSWLNSRWPLVEPRVTALLGWLAGADAAGEPAAAASLGQHKTLGDGEAPPPGVRSGLSFWAVLSAPEGGELWDGDCLVCRRGVGAPAHATGQMLVLYSEGGGSAARL